MDSTIEAMQKRLSCRTFSDRPLEEEKRKHLTEFLATNREGPFGGRVRFSLWNTSPVGKGNATGPKRFDSRHLT